MAAAGPLAPALSVLGHDLAGVVALDPTPAGVARLSVSRAPFPTRCTVALACAFPPSCPAPPRRSLTDTQNRLPRRTAARPPRQPKQALLYAVAARPSPLWGLLDFYVLGPAAAAAATKLRTRDVVVRET